MSEACLEKTAHSDAQRHRKTLRQSSYIATAAETVKNYIENWAGVWFKENVDPDDSAGKYAFQRLRHTWFTPELDPKFTLRRDDKFYAFGSYFVRGIEHSLTRLNIAVKPQPRSSPSMAYVKHQAPPCQIALHRRRRTGTPSLSRPALKHLRLRRASC
jgi:hypothetical protein